MCYKITEFKDEIASFLAMFRCDVLPSSSTQKMQAEGSFEMKVTLHQSTLRHIKVECNFKRGCHTNPKFNTGAMSVTLNLETFNLPERFFLKHT
jgi:hypothetical protein